MLQILNRFLRSIINPQIDGRRGSSEILLGQTPKPADQKREIDALVVGSPIKLDIGSAKLRLVPIMISAIKLPSISSSVIHSHCALSKVTCGIPVNSLSHLIQDSHPFSDARFWCRELTRFVQIAFDPATVAQLDSKPAHLFHVL